MIQHAGAALEKPGMRSRRNGLVGAEGIFYVPLNLREDVRTKHDRAGLPKYRGPKFVSRIVAEGVEGGDPLRRWNKPGQLSALVSQCIKPVHLNFLRNQGGQ
jgi:hypothetical protein